MVESMWRRKGQEGKDEGRTTKARRGDWVLANGLSLDDSMLSKSEAMGGVHQDHRTRVQARIDDWFGERDHHRDLVLTVD